MVNVQNCETYTVVFYVLLARNPHKVETLQNQHNTIRNILANTFMILKSFEKKYYCDILRENSVILTEFPILNILVTRIHI
jgi:hypothetical protein